jgi:hypothetical protein
MYERKFFLDKNILSDLIKFTRTTSTFIISSNQLIFGMYLLSTTIIPKRKCSKGCILIIWVDLNNRYSVYVYNTPRKSDKTHHI